MRRPARWLLVVTLLAGAGTALGGAISAQPASGAVLAVRISGLPSDTWARVTVRGPDGYVRRLRASRVLRNLEAGRYRINARSIPAAEFRYVPTVNRPSTHLRRKERESVRIRYRLVPPSGDAAAISAGGIHSCVLTRGGAVECWGYNARWQLGAVTSSWRSWTPLPVSGLTTGVQAITAGGLHTCALTSAAAALCWGAGDLGQVGDGKWADTLDPSPVSGLASGVAAISGGGWHTCAVTTSGGALCWGLGSNGQLGHGTDAPSGTPVGVSGLSSGVRAISAGVAHTCAVTTAGAALCWGYNQSGQLGDGTRTQRLAPVPVFGLSSGVVAISAGDAFTCALLSTGAVRCWGDQQYGQLGNGTIDIIPQETPVAVSGLSGGVTELSAGREHACVVTTAGAAKCWGRGDWGQLGDWKGKTTPTPVSVAFLSTGITDVDAGGLHSCAVMKSGAAWCWGSNMQGELGNGGMSGDGATKTPYVVIGYGIELR